MNLFAAHAQKYWGAGLPAIPLIDNSKKPAISRWQLYADAFPTEEEREAWIRSFPSGNIGLPMGPSSQLVAVDIDTDDAEILKVLASVMPDSPWVRVGKKGMIKVYRYNGERTTRIRDAAFNTICEILSKGTQFVLPPSIHPDTLRPYTANCELIDVHKSVPTLPKDFEQILRDALRGIGVDIPSGTNHKIVTFVPAGARDNTMVWHAGLLARAVMRGERTLVQALGEITSWVENFVEQVIGDPLTVEKAQSKLVEFLIKDVTHHGKSLPIGWDEGLSQDDKDKLELAFTEDDEAWNHAKVMDYILGEFDRHTDFRSPDRLQSITIALNRIAKAGTAISSLEESTLLRFIAGQSGGVVTETHLKKQLAEMKKGGIAGDNHKEIASAVIDSLSEYGEMRFDAGKLWRWNGAHWQEVKDEWLLEKIATEFGHYPATKRQNDHVQVMKLVKTLVTQPLQTVETTGVNFANGILTRDLELIEHRPGYGMTYILPYPYLPGKAGHMPMFTDFLLRAWGGDKDCQDKMDCLQEAIGATLMGVAPEYQTAFCLVGAAGSGKSTLLDVILGLIPEDAISTVAPHDWSDKFRLALMFGKRINKAGELSEDRKINGGVFKEVVEGAALTGEYKNINPFTFRPQAAQWFASNHLPKTSDYSNGFNRRWLFLQFNHPIPNDEKVPNFHEQLLDEREAIVAWAMEGFARLKKDGGYTHPPSSEAMKAEMAASNNSVRRWIADSGGGKLLVGLERTQQETPATTLHSEYYDYCIVNQISRNRYDLPDFVRRMNDLCQEFGIEEMKPDDGCPATRVCYRGIELLLSPRHGR